MIRALIGEGMHLVRGGLVALLEAEDDITVVAELDRGELIVPAALAARPHVAVVDMALPGLDGLAVAAALRSELPDCRTLLTADRASAEDLRRAIAAGAWGVVLKQSSPDQLAEAIRRVVDDQRVIDADLAFAALQTADSPLTPRELDVLRLAAEGATTAEIAGQLYLSVGTVRNYLSRIIAKTGARNRIDAIRIAGESGWL